MELTAKSRSIDLTTLSHLTFGMMNQGSILTFPILEKGKRLKSRRRIERIWKDTDKYYVEELCMKLVTVLLPEGYIEGLGELVRQNMYPSRSAAIRAAVRDLLKRELWKTG